MMSEPRRPLVTIDDPITIIEPHRVLLEWVDAVSREHFIVRSHNKNYHHDAEGTTWARGHHLPDSEVVVALRAAVSLIPAPEPHVHGAQGPRGVHGVSPLPSLPPLPPLPAIPNISDFGLKELMEEAHKMTEEANRTYKKMLEEPGKKSWWQTIVMRTFG